MRILLVGGGSGGHVTPLKAIALALEKQDQTTDLSVIVDRGFLLQSKTIFAEMPRVKLKSIFAGKLRRYHSKSFLWHLTHLPTWLKNLRDIIYLGLGFCQSLLFVINTRPDVIFCKGGFVSVPVGLAARLLKVPLVIHDSDTHPGLTNRILARYASIIATGMPPQYYHYPAQKMIYTGIPVSSGFQPLSATKIIVAKKQFGFNPDQPVVLITGGGLGAQRLNDVVELVAHHLLTSGWQIIHQTGKGKAESVRHTQSLLDKKLQKNWYIEEFMDMVPAVAAADIVVTRSGASAMQEFANAAKAVITVPSKYLTGGHQLKNATMFSEAKAALVLDEAELAKNPQLLVETIVQLSDSQLKTKLATNLHQKFAHPKAAEEIATLIIATSVSRGAK